MSGKSVLLTVVSNCSRSISPILQLPKEIFEHIVSYVWPSPSLTWLIEYCWRYDRLQVHEIWVSNICQHRSSLSSVQASRKYPVKRPLLAEKHITICTSLTHSIFHNCRSIVPSQPQVPIGSVASALRKPSCQTRKWVRPFSGAGNRPRKYWPVICEEDHCVNNPRNKYESAIYSPMAPYSHHQNR